MEKLLELNAISKHFSLGGGRTNIALDGINLSIYSGETLGILGESGCGKSTLARIIMGVYPPTKGEILFQGKPLSLNRRKERKNFARHAQMIFQDPYHSLDPHMTVREIIGENLKIHSLLPKDEVEQRIMELLTATGLLQGYAGRYPHEFSGGQRQRIGIARALAIRPTFLVCDEPVSSLDRATRGQIIDLLMTLKRDFNLTYLFIAHDIDAVRHISDRIAVMYAGKIVEIGKAEDICQSPQHPYTQLLLSSCLPLKPNSDWLSTITQSDGEVPTLSLPSTGCSFADRCPYVSLQCRTSAPPLLPISPHHHLSCWGG